MSFPEKPLTLHLFHTQIGLGLLSDPRDYISKLLLRDEVYEVPETDLITRIVRPGDTCIDAGCHIGYYSCLLAKLVREEGRVYSFDANPSACYITRRNLELNGLSWADVIQTALGDSEGIRPFHISGEDQTGLSSLGPISTGKETISVSCTSLHSFLSERKIEKVRLLKLDVEGAEEMVLRGLGSMLPSHLIDYVLVECFDERLKLLGTSTERIAKIFQSAGYVPWEYGIGTPDMWSQAKVVSSRGDCNYLFASTSASVDVPRLSMAGALQWTQGQKAELLNQKAELLNQKAELLNQIAELTAQNEILNQTIAKQHGDIDWLLESIKICEDESAQLAASNRELAAILTQVQNSASWRVLVQWRKLRDRLAPERSWHRRLYDSLLRPIRGRR